MQMYICFLKKQISSRKYLPKSSNRHKMAQKERDTSFFAKLNIKEL